jgi:cytochrome bd-type quinol oxidase subunit 2
MDSVRPSLPSLVALIYRDTGKALRALRHVALTACLISIAHSLARLILLSPSLTLTVGRDGRHWLALVLGAGWIFLMVPFLIAVHRYILLADTAEHYQIERSPRVLRFFGSWIVLSIVAGLPVVLALASLAAARMTEGWLVWGLIAPLIAALAVLCLRMTLLLPAIAVDAPGATWVNAYSDTRGHSLGILMIYLASVVPFVLGAAVAMVVAWLLLAIAIVVVAHAGASDQVVHVFATLTWLVVFNAVYVCTAVLMLVVASRLYQLLGDRVKGVPGPQTA